METSVAKEVICGVSMRDYERAVDGFCDGYGIQRSSVIRHWKAVSAARLAEFLERPLGELELVAVLINGNRDNPSAGRARTRAEGARPLGS